LSGIDVARVVKELASRAGFDASKYAGHSLRAGHATTAAIAGASERSIVNQTGIAPFKWFGAIYGTARYSGRTARESWGYSLRMEETSRGSISSLPFISRHNVR
jgi:hypothetical protein